MFTPGVTNSRYHGGETAWPLEPGHVIIDAGLSNEETILLLGRWGSTTITGCLRGEGGHTIFSHSSGAKVSMFVKIQVHQTRGVGTGSSCPGAPAAVNALYMDYASLNGAYYGTSGGVNNYQTLMGLSLPSPSITVATTWPTQTVSSVVQSAVCSFYENNSIGAATAYLQDQPYTKPGTGNPAYIGLFDIHKNWTLSWGIINGPIQATYTQHP
jgi:hypothetical protein